MATAAPERQPSNPPTNPVTTTARQQHSTTPQPQENDPESPLPARPTSTTPGPRATRLIDMYELTLKHALSKLTPDNFSSCYPTMASAAPTWLRDVRSRFLEGFGAACKQDFEKILARREVVRGLNELEGLVGDAARRKDVDQRQGGEDGDTPMDAQLSQRKPIPPHLLSAEKVLSAHMAPHLSAQHTQMQSRLQAVTGENMRLHEDVLAQRQELETILSRLEKVLADIDGANELTTAEADGLAKESRDVEVEMMNV